LLTIPLHLSNLRRCKQLEKSNPEGRKMMFVTGLILGAGLAAWFFADYDRDDWLA
jgi:hypothetical protein